MAAVVPISTVTINSSANSGSQAVTVPSDATFMIVATGESGGGVNGPYFPGSLTLNGVALTDVRTDPTTPNTGNSTLIKRLVNPAVGSQTFAWDWAGTATVTEGLTMHLRFYKSVDLTTPVKSSGGQTDDSGAGALLSTGALACVSGDLFVGIAGLFANAGATSVWSGATSVSAPAAFNNYRSDLAEHAIVSGTTITVTFDQTGGGPDTYHSLTGMVIAQSTASVSVEQYGYRFRNDDGTEATATWKAAQNTAASITPDETFRLRMGLNSTGNPAPGTVKLQYRKVGDESWRDVDTSG